MENTKYFYYVIELYYKAVGYDNGGKGTIEGIRTCVDGYLDVFTIQEEVMRNFSNVKSSLLVNAVEIKEEQYRKLAEKMVLKNTESKNKEQKILGSYICETMDWSAAEMSQGINELQKKINRKTILTGSSFEHRGCEYQIMLLSEKELSVEEIDNEIKKKKKEL
jgi:hypothetical protein